MQEVLEVARYNKLYDQKGAYNIHFSLNKQKNYCFVHSFLKFNERSFNVEKENVHSFVHSCWPCFDLNVSLQSSSLYLVPKNS